MFALLRPMPLLRLQDELLQHKARSMALQDELMDMQGTNGENLGDEVVMLRTRVQALQIEKDDALQAVAAAQGRSAEREMELDQLQMSLATMSQVSRIAAPQQRPSLPLFPATALSLSPCGDLRQGYPEAPPPPPGTPPVPVTSATVRCMRGSAVDSMLPSPPPPLHHHTHSQFRVRVTELVEAVLVL